MNVRSKVFLIAGPVASVMAGCVATAAQGGVLNIDVANYSFEAPTVAPYPALLTAPPWNMNGGGTVYEPYGPGTGTVAAGVGIFTNPGSSSAGHLVGDSLDGSQLAFLFNGTGNSISQGLVNPGNTNQATLFTVGQSYTLTVAVANATAAPDAGSTLVADLYYLDGTDQHILAETVITPTQLSGSSVTDFNVSTLTPVSAGDANQQINVGFFATGDNSGEFDIDNVRLTSVPEPGTLGLLGLAGGTMLLRRRRSGESQIP